MTTLRIAICIIAAVSAAGCRTKQQDTTHYEQLSLHDISQRISVQRADLHLFDTISISIQPGTLEGADRTYHYRAIRHANLTALETDTTQVDSSSEKRTHSQDDKQTKWQFFPIQNPRVFKFSLFSLLIIIAVLVVRQLGHHKRGL